MLDGYSSLSRATFVPSCLKMFGSNEPFEAMALFFSQEGRLREFPTHKRLRGCKNNCLQFACYLKTLSYILCSLVSFICLPEQGDLKDCPQRNMSRSYILIFHASKVLVKKTCEPWYSERYTGQTKICMTCEPYTGQLADGFGS